MACIALFANPLAMTTTHFTRAACHGEISRWQPEVHTDFRPLSMNWVVVVDKNGSRHLGVNWAADKD
jgi:hypothetical protein